MARHRNYSKRSRESRKAMSDGFGDEPPTDEGAVEDWHAAADEPAIPPDSRS